MTAIQPFPSGEGSVFDSLLLGENATFGREPRNPDEPDELLHWRYPLPLYSPFIRLESRSNLRLGREEGNYALLAESVEGQAMPAANAGLLEDVLQVNLDGAGPDAER